jgi:hypothetical protein
MKRNESGEMMVQVVWKIDGSTTFEPLSNFYTDRHVNVKMDRIIKKYKKTALEYPFRKRHCLLCDERVRSSMLFCRRTKCSMIKHVYE